MDPLSFTDALDKLSARIVGQLLSLPDVSRSRAHELKDIISTYLNDSVVTNFFNLLIHRLEYFGESSESISTYKAMMSKIQNPFGKLQTEKKCLKYFSDNETYISPQQIDILHVDVKCSYQFFPLRRILKEFLEFPGSYDSIMDYLEKLEKDKILLSNVVQGSFWKRKKTLFGDKKVLPMFLYNDDFEINNPLGTHRGVSKIGAVYVVIPCLPPQLQSKTKYIFPITLYKTADTKEVPMYKFFAKAVEELNFLEETGVNITTPHDSVTIHFSVAGLIGDNLAVNTVLGFQQHFSSNYPCRFCLVHFNDIRNTLNVSQCVMRTEELHIQHVAQCAPSNTGVSGISALSGLNSASTLELCTVDLMHDILEGVWQYDVGLILYDFIKLENFLTLDILNERIDNLFYGNNEKRNKPRNVTIKQIREKFIKMSAAESQCFLRNIGVLIGDVIPRGNSHWRLIIILKQIHDIVTAPSIQLRLHLYLSDLISEYLSLLNSLVKDHLKMKHHMLLHYPQLMERFGPLRSLSTMRCESKNKDLKNCAESSLSRLNPCKTIATKCQLQANYRKQLNHPVEGSFSYVRGGTVAIAAKDLPEFSHYDNLLPIQAEDIVFVTDSLSFRGREINENVVVMIPSEERVDLFVIHKILLDKSNNLYLVSRDVSEYAEYDEHYQSYSLDSDYDQGSQSWRCFTLEHLKFRFVSRIVENVRGDLFIPKRWI